MKHPRSTFSSHSFKLKSGEQKVRLGFFALTELQDFSTGAIRPHEKTLDAPKEDRLKLMLACNAQLSPIFVLYAQPKQTVHRILSVAVEGMAPFIETELDSGDELKLWRVSDPAVIEKVQREMAEQTLLIADGHHRYEATLRYRDQLRSERGPGTGNEAYNFILTYFANIDDDNVVILPTHRLVRGFTPQAVFGIGRSAANLFLPRAAPENPGRQEFVFESAQERRQETPRHRRQFQARPALFDSAFEKQAHHATAGQRLERAAQRTRCQHAASADPRTYPRHVARGASQRRHHPLLPGRRSGACKRWKRKISKRRSFLAATKKDEIQAIVAANEKMPQKSTYFYPKLSSGLIVNKIDVDEQIPT